MKKKSQIRKYSVQKVSQLTKTETIPQMLKLYAEHVQDKKNKLKQKKELLLQQINQIRKQSQKVVYDMIDGVKDRIQKKQKVVMNAHSRPTPQDIKNLTQLFAYMQNQKNLIHINSTQSQNLLITINNLSNSLNNTPADYILLDQTYQKLQLQCQREQQQRDRLLQQMNKNRQFYNVINNTIAQYRKKYDIIQSQIAQRQKYLDHLVMYFKTRQNQDKQKIQNQLKRGYELQTQLLKTQQIINVNSNKNVELQIRQNQYQSRISLQQP